MQGNGTERFCKRKDFRNLFAVELRDRGVDLKRYPGTFGGVNSSHCPLKGARYAAKRIMLLRGCAVYADTDALDAGILHFFRNGRGDQRAVRGHNHSQAAFCSVAGDIEYIRPQKGFAAG